MTGTERIAEEERRSSEEWHELLSERALLREELWHQWEANHWEHCSADWPHREGARCHWPIPDLLAAVPRGEPK